MDNIFRSAFEYWSAPIPSVNMVAGDKLEIAKQQLSFTGRFLLFYKYIYIIALLLSSFLLSHNFSSAKNRSILLGHSFYNRYDLFCITFPCAQLPQLL